MSDFFDPIATARGLAKIAGEIPGAIQDTAEQPRTPHGGNGRRPTLAAMPAGTAVETEELCETLIAAPDLAYNEHILESFVSSLHLCGVAGEDRFAKVVYLSLTSRVLDRPVSVAAKGPSSAGKSYVVEKVVERFPKSAYHALSGMSEHALAYSQEPLSHRFLVIYEAAGLEGEFASYLMRSLLSEGRIRYETVEKVKGGGLQPRLIEREGPTGLIVTTTAVSLHPENETRLLSVPANDTPEQTKHVLRVLACEDESLPTAELDAWCDLQTWIAAQENRVTIPFAPRLAELIPPVAVRLRRDFATVLSLIKAHAVLHQATRQRDASGRIVALLDDYAVVRELVADLIADEVGAMVPATVAETVAAVAELAPCHEHGVTYLQLGEHLKLDKSSAMRRARVAVAGGYLKNLETHRGQPAKLVLDEPLPGEVVILPQPEELTGCAVACSQRGGTSNDPEPELRLGKNPMVEPINPMSVGFSPTAFTIPSDNHATVQPADEEASHAAIVRHRDPSEAPQGDAQVLPQLSLEALLFSEPQLPA